jgi:CheY-like chemotaxis protein
VNGDSVRLEQIISNLLENAAKYTQPGGRLELKLRKESGQAHLSVRDNGIGLAPENLEIIFDLFNQVDSSVSRTGGGLGIGLTLVRRVLALHGGSVEARSAGLGHGTEFIVRLPVVAPKSAPKSNSDIDASARTPAAHARVLIVDDNADSADSLALVARSWGHDVAVARDGPSALALAAKFQPERALVDIGLPGMDGYELGRRLRAAHRHLYLVAMTGYGRAEDRKTAHAAGFDLHLVKPADLDELQALLANGGPKSSP